MDAVRSLALDLVPVLGVLAVLLGAWVWGAVLSSRAAKRSPAPHPHGGPTIPRPRAAPRDRELTRD